MLSSHSKTLDSLQTLNEDFTFDWSDYRTVKSNKKKTDELESALKRVEAIAILEGKERQSLGQLCYKLGTFYNHIERLPIPAFKKLFIAENILTGNELAWTKNHIAFSYQQALAVAKKEMNLEKIEENKTQALAYCNQVIKQYESFEESDIESIKIIAFAYCVQALVEYEVNQLDVSIKSYRFALDLYEKYGLLDDQYARAKNRYAQFLVEKKNHVEANKAFEELEVYWSKKQDDFNPYAARFYVSYADYLAKNRPENLALALDKYKKAYEILRASEGEQSAFARDIYSKISEIQEKLSIDSFEMPLNVYSKSAVLLQFRPAVIDSEAQVSEHIVSSPSKILGPAGPK